MWQILALGSVLLGSLSLAQSDCPGYAAQNIQQHSGGLTADLHLAGPPCNVYGTDLPNLTLTVEYQSDTRLHVMIEDRDQMVYQVPQSVLPRPAASSASGDSESQLQFTYTEAPFSFAVSRRNGEVLFSTSGTSLIFESQYLRLRTSLPANPNLYGLGEHSDHFRLNTSNYTRTLWSRDAYAIPAGTNLYGNHPVYLDHRGSSGTHGVLLVNSNGMDIKINDTDGQYLEYNTLGGVLDFYFMAGPSPVEAAQQVADVVGRPAMMSYWTFGYHQCRYGYRDVYQVAEVVYNYSKADIPLETMWTDIDYMDQRKVFTLDPARFPLSKMTELVDHLHSHQQHYVVMVDPAVAYQDYPAFNNGRDVFMKTSNGSIFQGVVWPGVTAFPDWFHPDTQQYWNQEFATFFSADSGVDIDALWIDMNEPSNFCNYPCSDPEGYAEENHFPPEPPPVRTGAAVELPGWPNDFQPGSNTTKRQDDGLKKGLPDRRLIDPPYSIQNAAGSLSNKTIDTNLVHYNGLVEYDTHNLYGTMMSSASRTAMLHRRPSVRPLVITRSTFLGAGAQVGHWTGDNQATWDQYYISIPDMLNFNSIFQVPMVGSDVCGFGGNTTATLCARWMMLGAFYPFYRNHNEVSAIPQEAYRWPMVAAAARYAIDIRYRLLDYWYTTFYQQTMTATPSLNPLFYLYPEDSNTFPIDGQFFFGDAVLVSPVLEENSTSVDIYLPDDVFYDWNNGFMPVRGNGSNTTLDNVGFTMIPLHVRGGSILPLRAKSAKTTTELRKQPFQLLIAPGVNGTAKGSLYLDEGNQLEQPSTTSVIFTYDNETLTMRGMYDFVTDVAIESILICGASRRPGSVTVDGSAAPISYNSTTQLVTINATIPLTADARVEVGAGGMIQENTGAASAWYGSAFAAVPLAISLVLSALG